MRRSGLIVPLLLLAGACATTQPARAPSHRLPAAQPEADLSEPPGTWHVIKPGETLWALAQRYGSSVDEILDVNGLQDPDELVVGQSLFVPAPDPMAPAPAPGGAMPAPPEEDTAPAAANAPLIWPLEQGVLFSEFGPRAGSMHDGVDLGAPDGTPIRAAADGTVIFSAADQGTFGTILVIQHAQDRVTVYAHNQENLVKEGEQVKQGQTVARVGHSGSAQSPHVHFEVRQARKALNPVPLLPAE